MHATRSSNPHIAFFGILVGWVSRTPPPPGVVFDRKWFFPKEDHLYAVGSLAGTGKRHQNTTQITCDKQAKECLTSAIEAIGFGDTYVQLGRLESPSRLAVVRWDAREIIASDAAALPSFWCLRTTVYIDLKSEEVTWVEEPINRDTTFCQQADPMTYRWRLEDPKQPWERK